MQRPRRILHIVSSLGVGGMERMLLQLSTAQQEAGHRVSVLALRAGALQQEAADRSIRARVLSSGGGRLGRSLEALRYFWEENPDIVHVHNPTSLQYAVLSKLVSHPAIVVTIHGDQDTHARLGSPLEWKLTSAAVIVSHAAGKTLQLPSHAGPFIVVHNGIAAVMDDEKSRAVTRAELSAGDSCVGIMVARIDGKKGHGTLLKSLKSLKSLESLESLESRESRESRESLESRESRESLTMWIVGDGAERVAAEAQAAQLGLGADRVKFLGRRSDVDRLLNAADFFVLPSDIEGLPMSILEAMAHGLPIVASGVGGVPEIIRDEIDGLLVPAGDSAALAAAMERVAADRALRRRLGDAARERASTAFSLATMVRSYDEVYDGALAGGGTRR